MILTRLNLVGLSNRQANDQLILKRGAPAQREPRAALAFAGSGNGFRKGRHGKHKTGFGAMPLLAQCGRDHHLAGPPF